jgi:hypothetical protein
MHSDRGLPTFPIFLHLEDVGGCYASVILKGVKFYRSAFSVLDVEMRQ